MSRKVYLAAPLFTIAERQFNAELALYLRKFGHEVFLPQENQPYIFESDLAGLRWCDVIVAVLDGADPDSGTSWAYASGVPVIACSSVTVAHDSHLSTYRLANWICCELEKLHHRQVSAITAAGTAAPLNGWQPIATACKDGPIDLWITGDPDTVRFYCPVTIGNGGRIADVHWRNGKWWPLGGLGHSLSPNVTPTHWMAQPGAPT